MSEHLGNLELRCLDKIVQFTDALKDVLRWLYVEEYVGQQDEVQLQHFVTDEVGHA